MDENKAETVVVPVGGGYDPGDVRYGLHLIANEDCDEVAAAYYAKKALAHLAAPARAPEGGAVLSALDMALTYIEELGANIERNDLDMHLDVVERPFSFAQTMRGRFPALCAALTPKEAPADAAD